MGLLGGKGKGMDGCACVRVSQPRMCPVSPVCARVPLCVIPYSF